MGNEKSPFASRPGRALCISASFNRGDKLQCVGLNPVDKGLDAQPHLLLGLSVIWCSFGCQHQSSAVVIATTWPVKPKQFPVGLFIGKVG